jgi:hypothetical protein
MRKILFLFVPEVVVMVLNSSPFWERYFFFPPYESNRLTLQTQHAADIFENGDKSTSYMRKFWRWRPEVTRRNGLEEGPGGPRDIAPKKTS